MARSCEELFSLVAPGRSGHALLVAQTHLRFPADAHGDTWEGSQAAALLLVHPDDRARRRLGAVAEAFLSGRSRVVALPSLLDLPSALLPFGNQLDLVVCAPPGMDLSALPPVAASGMRLVVGIDAAPVTPGAAFDGVVTAGADRIGDAVAVFRMVAGMLAPELGTCVDAEDLLALFQPGCDVRLVHGGFMDGEMVWQYGALEKLAAATTAALMLDSLDQQESREVRRIVSDVRRRMKPGAELLVNESVGFFCPVWPTNLRPVTVICCTAGEEPASAT